MCSNAHVSFTGAVCRSRAQLSSQQQQNSPQETMHRSSGAWDTSTPRTQAAASSAPSSASSYGWTDASNDSVDKSTPRSGERGRRSQLSPSSGTRRPDKVRWWLRVAVSARSSAPNPVSTPTLSARGFYYFNSGQVGGLSTVYSLVHCSRTSHQRVVELASTSALCALFASQSPLNAVFGRLGGGRRRSWSCRRCGRSWR